MQLSVKGGGSAWEWSEVRKAFYLHQFNVDEPDLNFANPAVIEEFKVTNCV
jgi:glycosidase